MPYRNETGQMEGVVITFADISVVKEAEQKLLFINQELEQKVEYRVRALRDEIQERLRIEQALKKKSNSCARRSTD